MTQKGLKSLKWKGQIQRKIHCMLMVKIMGSDFELHVARIGFVKFLALLFFLFRFVCDNCLKKTGRTRKENKFSAKSKSDVSISVIGFHSLCQRISSFASICQILAF